MRLFVKTFAVCTAVLTGVIPVAQAQADEPNTTEAVAEPKTISLEMLIERALNADPRISEHRKLVDAARALLQEALGHQGVRYDVNSFVGFSTNVDGGFYTSGRETCGIDQTCTPRSDEYDVDNIGLWANVSFQIIKPLYTFGKIENYSEAAKGNIEVKQGDVKLQRNKVGLDASRAYYGYLTAKDTRFLLKDILKRLDSAQALANEWLEQGKGKISQADVYALQTGIGVAKRYMAQAEAFEAIALAGIRLLGDYSAEEKIELEDKRITPVELPPESLAVLQQRALEKRPEMAQLEAGLNARRSLVAANKAGKKPNIYAGLVGAGSYSPDRDRLDNPHVFDPFNYAGATPVLGIKWDWASGVQPARVAGAQAELEALLEKAAFARQGIPFEVEEQYHQAHGYYKAVQEMENASRAGRRWMIGRYVDFEAGLEDPTKVLEAVQGYVLAHSEYLTTVNDYNMHVVKLITVSGGYQ